MIAIMERIGTAGAVVAEIKLLDGAELNEAIAQLDAAYKAHPFCQIGTVLKSCMLERSYRRLQT